MIEELFEEIMPFIIGVIEILGVIVLIVGVSRAFYLWVKEQLSGKNTKFGHPLTKATAAALEFLMAAEVLKTILLKDYKSILIIVCIIILRAAFVLLLHYEAKHEPELEFDDDEESAEGK